VSGFVGNRFSLKPFPNSWRSAAFLIYLKKFGWCQQKGSDCGSIHYEAQMLTAGLPKMTEAELKQFEDLFHEHHRFVYETARAITGCREDAEDVLQTIFLRLIRGVTPPSFYKNSKGYFYRASVNLSLNAVRSRSRRVPLTDPDLLAGAQHSHREESDETILRRLLETVATLSPRTVEIVILRYVHDYTEAEIAKLLGRSRCTIAVTLFRARARLRKLGQLRQLE
jgi:RNA polymerase sigma factor (sigma-70 family)